MDSFIIDRFPILSFKYWKKYSFSVKDGFVFTNKHVVDAALNYKVVLNDYHGSRPYNHFKSHKVKYYKGYKGKPQKTIGVRKNVDPKKTYNNRNQKNDKGNKRYEKENKGHGKDKH